MHAQFEHPRNGDMQACWHTYTLTHTRTYTRTIGARSCARARARAPHTHTHTHTHTHWAAHHEGFGQLTTMISSKTFVLAPHPFRSLFERSLSPKTVVCWGCLQILIDYWLQVYALASRITTQVSKHRH